MKTKKTYVTKVKIINGKAMIPFYKKYVGKRVTITVDDPSYVGKRVKITVDDPSIADLTEMSYEHGQGKY